jgi:hypothetical protein
LTINLNIIYLVFHYATHALKILETCLDESWTHHFELGLTKFLFLFSVIDFYNGRIFSKFSGGHHGRDRMVVGFITTYAFSIHNY